MKTIGLLGGMSWESTVTYYRAINEGVKRELGGLHSAKIALFSVDFAPIEQLQHAGDWARTAVILGAAARSVEAAGADCLVICTNTMHKVAADIEGAIQIPLLHIADATADVLRRDGIQTVGLLGTAFTMEQNFYKGRLADKYGLKVLIPGEKDRGTVQEAIYNELCVGRTTAAAKPDYLRIIDELAGRGAQAIIRGCTEIGMLVNHGDTDVRLYDTTLIHAEKAVAFAMQ